VRLNLSSVEYWEISYITTQILSDSQDADQATARILHLLGTRLEAVFAAFWVLDGTEPGIRCAALWPDTDPPKAFATVTKSRIFRIGEGLPGMVWEKRDVVWIPSVQASVNFPRASVAKVAGLKTGIAFPAYRGKAMLAVIEIFGEEEQGPSKDLINFLQALGGQIGLFLAHFDIAATLSNADRQFHLVADASRDAVITINENSTVLFANPAIYDLLGYKPEELVGESLTVIMPESLRERHHAGIRRYNEAGERHLDWDNITLPGRHKDGSEVPLQLAFGQFWRAGKRVFTGFIRREHRPG
jgi:PAS domain S-box-containing protein